VWVEIHALTCSVPEENCENIVDGEICKLPGMASNYNGMLECLWVEGNTSAQPPVAAKCVLKVINFFFFFYIFIFLYVVFVFMQ
jgi:hypothetical protein